MHLSANTDDTTKKHANHDTQIKIDEILVYLIAIEAKVKEQSPKIGLKMLRRVQVFGNVAEEELSTSILTKCSGADLLEKCK